METLLILLLIYLVATLIILPLWTILKIRGHDAEVDSLRQRLGYAENELRDLRARPPAPAAVPPQPTPPVAPAPAVAAVVVPPPPLVVAPVPVMPAAATSTPIVTPSVIEPPLLPPVIPAPTRPTVPVYVPPATPDRPAINWEQFMGAKLFAWLGGLALFLGVAFFVKYSFEHDLIPPEVRVALGFLTGAGLIIGGLKLDRERYRITAQTLIAAGVVSLYAVTFACNSVYHFAFFGPVPTFLLMVLITATAFILAVRLPAQVVAILGMLGGFLTPVLLSTGRDNPVGLFGYLALLDAGLIAVALRTGWRHLVPMGAAGTVLMLFGWTGRFFNAEKSPVAMIVCLGSTALYLAAAELARRRDLRSRAFSLTAAALPLVGFAYALYFLSFPSVAGQVPLYLGFVLLLDAALLSLAWRDDFLPRIHVLAGLAAFALLGLWTGGHLTDARLPWALAFYLGFAGLHTVFPLWLERVRPEAGGTGWSQLFAPLTLLLLLLPIWQLDAVPFVIWPAILLIDVLAIGLAVATASLASVAAVLVLTLIATGLCLFRVPAGLDLPFTLLLAIGGFAVFFFAASFWLARRLGDRLPAGAGAATDQVFGNVQAQLPAFSSLLPFLLLIMASARLAVPDPSMIFGLALLLVALTLGLARLLRIDWLPLCALAGVAALEFAWHSRHFSAAAPALPLFWYLGFYAVFAVYPFLFKSTFADRTGPWAVAALAGIAHFPLVHRVIATASPNEFMGLLPALFAVPPLLSLGAILKGGAADNPKRLNQLAWFGGATLFFITLIFPLQFERQWITIGWALEGVALLWLFHRLPHPGLRATGVVLLGVAFVRLTLNGAVFSYHVRGDTPILNWYLYAYSLVIAALFLGARLLAPPRERVLGITAPPLLNTLAVILAFLLLNIQIADFFTTPGAATLTFKFSGSFARDMTYTIAWALFALGLLGAGIWKGQRAPRYAAIALLSVALFKLFFHDLARLQALYRVGALMAVAVIAILASFAYQRFLPVHEKTPPPTS
ncbi:hypothetical protein Verru16b_01565 [Lacunisphaera limnophila]|uniref:DUF2339 domain-containing protein n=1 Tax=Lacunisphaera limnophila TaxID=1838286 RepID=A0A1D8AUE5_9BACT|nr:DUF2339 domain-containing protein [Lacunisphaera limnophila]AOS44503.1 hypothetical protein Verru16b_01565 [Lacunisphaera limnophila]